MKQLQNNPMLYMLSAAVLLSLPIQAQARSTTDIIDIQTINSKEMVNISDIAGRAKGFSLETEASGDASRSITVRSNGEVIKIEEGNPFAVVGGISTPLLTSKTVEGISLPQWFEGPSIEDGDFYVPAEFVRYVLELTEEHNGFSFDLKEKEENQDKNFEGNVGKYEVGWGSDSEDNYEITTTEPTGTPKPAKSETEIPSKVETTQQATEKKVSTDTTNPKLEDSTSKQDVDSAVEGDKDSSTTTNEQVIEKEIDSTEQPTKQEGTTMSLN